MLQEELRIARAQRFGRKSGKWTAEEVLQAQLFNEAEVGNGKPPETNGDVAVHAYRRGTPRRHPLPPDLPRQIVTLDIPEEQKVCGCGNPLERIGEEVSEKLDIVPATCKVIRYARPKRACKRCQGAETEGAAVKIAPPAVQLLLKSIATPGLMAYLLAGKHCDGLPFYRQEKIFERLGIDVSRTSMCEWTLEVAKQLQLLMSLMKMRILADNYVHADETVVKVLREPGRKADAKSYMWVFRSGGDAAKPTILFEYHPSRSEEVARGFFRGFQGWVQTDGYVGYEELGRQPGIVLIGCMAHVRRKFHDVRKASGGATAADEALEFIRNLYKVEWEADANGLDWEQRAELRRLKSVPVLEAFHLWLHGMEMATPPKGLLGKAVAHALGQWDRVIRHVENGRLRPDNNLALCHAPLRHRTQSVPFQCHSRRGPCQCSAL